MTPYQRWSEILDMLARDGEVVVENVADALGVSAATIRRDLDSLARQQLLARTRGGAVAHAVAYDRPLRYKAGRRAPEKQRIGAAAAALLPAGAVVGLNGGTTTTEVARALGARTDLQGRGGGPALTLVTNALNIANELAVRPQIKIVVIGGVIRPQSYELIGALATTILREITLDVAVIGVDAVDPGRGAMTHNEEEATINALLVDAARQVIVAADSVKLGRTAFARICPIDRVDVLVTDEGASDETIRPFVDAAGEVVRA